MILLNLTAAQQTTVNKQQQTPVRGEKKNCLSLLVRGSEGSTRQRELGGYCPVDI